MSFTAHYWLRQVSERVAYLRTVLQELGLDCSVVVGRGEDLVYTASTTAAPGAVRRIVESLPPPTVGATQRWVDSVKAPPPPTPPSRSRFGELLRELCDEIGASERPGDFVLFVLGALHVEMIKARLTNEEIASIFGTALRHVPSTGGES